tara:strand:+ start:540 stop:815 length:276 start_codon:yes stop_codon:yes gene_type:complete
MYRQVKKTIYDYLTCKIDNSIQDLTNSLDKNVKEEIMDLKIFNERIQNEMKEEQVVERLSNIDDGSYEILKDGERGLSLKNIIQSRRENLD